MNILQKMLGIGNEEKSLEVTFVSDCLCDGRPYSEGQTVTFPERVARQLVGAGRAYCPAEEAAADSERQENERLIPSAFEKLPAPDSFKNLPDCFAKHWDLHQALVALCKRHDAIEGKLLEIATKFTYKPSANAYAGLSGPNLARAVRMDIAGGMNSADVERNLKPIRILEDALVRISQAIDDWKADHQAALTKLAVQCSDYTQQMHGELCRDIRNLHGLGFELFNTRIAALGLSEHHARNLFGGSSDCLRFAAIEEPALQDLKLGWYTPGTGPRYIVGTTVATMASILQNWQPIADEVQRLTKQASTELSKAKRVLQAA